MKTIPMTRTTLALTILLACLACRGKPKVPPEEALHRQCSAQLDQAIAAVRMGQISESQRAWMALESNIFSASDGPGAVRKPYQGKMPSDWYREWKSQFQREVGRSVEPIAAAVGALTAQEQDAVYFVKEYGTADDVNLLRGLLTRTQTVAHSNAEKSVLFECTSVEGGQPFADGRRASGSLQSSLCGALTAALQGLAGSRQVVRQVPAGSSPAIRVTAAVEEDSVIYKLSNNDRFYITVGVRVTLSSEGSAWGSGRTLKASGETPRFSQARGGASPVDEMSRSRDALATAMTGDLVKQFTALGPL